MRYWDHHSHSLFSADSDAAMADMAAAARRTGLSGILFTEHIDLNHPSEKEGLFFSVDMPGYRQAIEETRAENPDMIIGMGLEVGLTGPENQAYFKTPGLDFAIASLHVVHGKDPYDGAYYEGKTRHEAYLEYLEAMAEMMPYAEGASVLGHIGYAAKAAPYAAGAAAMGYEEFGMVLDEILRRAVRYNLGLELNTSGYDSPAGHGLPSVDILARYRELGGRILTLGSDAHEPGDVGRHFKRALMDARAAGFMEIAVFSAMSPRFIAIDRLLNS
ncbi:histidinol-phosphatase HisJ family protein [Gehongia tenuis]|uniref:Histidinol-phosphatase n=1 Tax=Gehongia tenuis TaxID=2763655 RepID=A0A926D6Q4_9FIRM|nr:histidinol-phosphatase HisJ family protein [Gehongia tenuis]MBC8532271.1 histidinol-phosphatase HisJ family protein [Gehongia tenuis]